MEIFSFHFGSYSLIINLTNKSNFSRYSHICINLIFILHFLSIKFLNCKYDINFSSIPGISSGSTIVPTAAYLISSNYRSNIKLLSGNEHL